ncbi:MAG: ABC transporter permease [Eubacteriales bacterium]|jgi:ABC-2 type transport system permease protein|nr:ABC transporter permease [Eubacteriales bacterium]
MPVILKTKAVLMTREYIALFFSIVFCPMLLVIFGSAYGNDPSPILQGEGTIDVMLPSFTGLLFAGSGLISLPVAVSSSRERGELRRYRMTPLSPLVFLLCDVLIYFLISVIGMLLVLLLGQLLYDVHFTGSILQFIYGFTLSGTAMFSLGLLIASLSKNAKIAQTAGMAVGFPMMFLSGSTIPIEMMPDKIETVSHAMPLTYCVSLMRDIWEKHSMGDLMHDSLILVCITAAFLLLTALTFRWD